MFSERMMELGKKSSVIREIFEYGRKRKAEIGAQNVFDFSLGNPSIPAPKKFDETMIELLKNESSVSLHGYTSAAGDDGVREMVSEYIEKTHSFAIPKNLIYMTCGAAAALTITLNALYTEGDEIILLAPYFPEYKVFSEKAGFKVREVKCHKDTMQIDFDGLKAALNEKTKAVIINSPNNPTGAVYPEKDIKKLSDILKGTKTFIIADEPYRELYYGNDSVPYIPKYYKNTVVCYSFSKSLSIPGERIGYIAVSPDCDGAPDLFAAVCGAGRALGYVCAPSILQKAVAKNLGLTSDINAYRENRDILYNALQKIGYKCISPDGAFYLFVEALGGDAKAFCEKAKKEELLLVPSDDFGVSGYIRISYCVDKDMIKRSIPHFEKAFKGE
ncbi:MAG: pyridoxal phosphate-dependent aminotransferase [Oscillospiraceae bacterium]|nr:pyridoxal phosphate-dependent aminotransferase [Oscillospiraceae bacterium]